MYSVIGRSGYCDVIHIMEEGLHVHVHTNLSVQFHSAVMLHLHAHTFAVNTIAFCSLLVYISHL